jgi:hypothetical protein
MQQRRRTVSRRDHKSSPPKEIWVAALRAFPTDVESILVVAAGVFCIFAPWLLFPPPRLEELTEVTGTLTSYSVETDQSWSGRVAKRTRLGSPPSEYVLFSVADHAGRFWTDSVTPTNVTEVFPRVGLALHFYRSTNSPYIRVNGDGEKVYGLSVEGYQLRSAEDDITHDSFLAHYVLPAMGVGLLLLVVLTGRLEARRAARQRPL